VPMLALGAVQGGAWLWVALAYLTVFSFLMDRIGSMVNLPVPQDSDAPEFPAADALSAALAAVQIALLPLAIWALAVNLSGVQVVVAWAAFGLYFGQIGNSNAHELIHRARKPLFWLGQWVFTLMLFGHHTSAHRLVHHVHVATPHDPNSARAGEGVYTFIPRAWIGSFRAGLAAERARDAARRGVNPYWIYVGGALGGLTLVWLWLGASGLAAYLALAAYVQAQILLSDYVQHYGLMRARRPDGRPEPVGPQHSWNGRQWFSSALMLNAPRHSDHHAHPARPYPALKLPDGAAILPGPLPAMVALALFPPIWRRIMDPRAARVRARASAAADAPDLTGK
jgi:alkane 1-monooxygenase